MGMYCALRQVSDDEIRSLLGEPGSAILKLVDQEEGEVDLDKAWHGIHFLLTGSAWEGAEPLCYLVTGGTPFENVEDSDGTFRALGSRQVAAFAEALAPISAKTLRARYDPQAMSRADIYPDIWVRDGDEALDYLLEYFEVLKSFVSDAAGEQSGALIYIG